MPPLLELIIGFVCIAALPLLSIISALYFNHQDKQEEAKAKQVWEENQTLIIYYNMLKEKNIKLTNRREELRKKLADKVYFPDESTFFRKFEVEYQEIYFKQEKVSKELIKTMQEIRQIAKQNNVRCPWEFS